MKFGGHPTPHVGEFTNRGKWRGTKGADFRREIPSRGLSLQRSLLGVIRPQEAVPQLGELPPPPLYLPRGPIVLELSGVGLGDLLPEPFLVVSQSFPQLIDLFIDELLRNSGRRFEVLKLAWSALCQLLSIRAFFSLQSF